MNSSEKKEKQKLYYQKNKEKLIKKAVEWRNKNRGRVNRKRRELYKLCPDRVVSDWRRRNYKRFNLTIEKYQALFESQKGLCAICSVYHKDYGKRLSIDHNHKTGKIRGVLCHSCNTSLGGFKDSVEILNKAIEYLEAYTANDSSGVIDAVILPWRTLI